MKSFIENSRCPGHLPNTGMSLKQRIKPKHKIRMEALRKLRKLTFQVNTFSQVGNSMVCVEEEINGGERQYKARNWLDTAISPLLVFLEPCDNPQMWTYSCTMKMSMMVPESYVYKHLFISLPTLGVQQIMTLLLLKWDSLAGLWDEQLGFKSWQG
jgi:hypothetical protein